MGGGGPGEEANEMRLVSYWLRMDVCGVLALSTEGHHSLLLLCTPRFRCFWLRTILGHELVIMIRLERPRRLEACSVEAWHLFDAWFHVRTAGMHVEIELQSELQRIYLLIVHS